jgi:hypothetical protein
MDSVFFLLSVVGIVIVVVWSVVNDRLPRHGRTRGLLAMRDDEADEPGHRLNTSAKESHTDLK